MKNTFLLIAFGISILASSCGGGIGPSNVSACKSLISKLKCGSVANPISEATCDGYVNTTCDFAPYFRCLEGAYVCTNGMYDQSKLGMVGSCTVPTCR